MGRQGAGAAVDVSRVRAEIDLYGWALQYVEAEDAAQAFGYTAGLQLRGLPEIAVVGLSAEDTWAVLNDLAEDCTSGRVPSVGQELSGLVRGVTFTVGDVADPSCLTLAQAVAGEGAVLTALVLEPVPTPVHGATG